ncbi:hypothetical protein M5689_017355 [Euphorbia peplus]|nr:hypothetical protein M5689_017355 [Euphorbia peplus]
MSQGSVYERGNQQQQHGWETTSHDYNLHISRIEKMTSFLPDVPRYPVLHRLFNNRIVSEEQPKKKNKSPSKSTKKVHILDQKQQQEEEQDSISAEQNVDTETDGFIQQRRKGFELCKWKTFKLH